MTFIPWPEIESFHNIKKYTSVDAHPEILNGQSIVNYRPKLKMHGTNSAIQIHKDGTIICQSRECIITSEKDNAGFARWVEAHKEDWKQSQGYIVYGEWVGQGIQKGVAVSSIPKRSFTIFAIRPLDDLNSIIVEPDEIQSIIKNIPTDTYILPWYNEGLEVDWAGLVENLTNDVNLINKWVAAVEANDPWVESVFGIKGVGEGLVFYPRSDKHLLYAAFVNLVFKAKGDKHKNIATAAPAQVDASVATSIDSFVDMVLTPARLEQGATKVSIDGSLSFDIKLTGKFVVWVSSDVEKESKDELVASGLTWKQVQRALADKARVWYIAKSKEL